MVVGRTDEAICEALGLGRIEEMGTGRVIRVLLTPSFHPPACVVMEAMRLRVAAMGSMLRREPLVPQLPTLVETGSVTEAQFERIAEGFERALVEQTEGRGRFATLDGMPISAVRVEGSMQRGFRGHPGGAEGERFVSEVLWLAHGIASTVQLRNRIAACGRYVDGRFCMEPEPALPRVTQVVVLGEEAERAAYFARLKQYVDSRKDG